MKKKRKIIVVRRKIDAKEYIPEADYNVIYAKRSFGIVGQLPDVVYQKAKVIFAQEEGIFDTRYIKENAVIDCDFRSVDLDAICKQLGYSRWSHQNMYVHK